MHLTCTITEAHVSLVHLQHLLTQQATIPPERTAEVRKIDMAVGMLMTSLACVLVNLFRLCTFREQLSEVKWLLVETCSQKQLQLTFTLVWTV